MAQRRHTYRHGSTSTEGKNSLRRGIAALATVIRSSKCKFACAQGDDSTLPEVTSERT